MLKVAEPINFMTRQAKAVSAIEEHFTAVITHSFDIDCQLRCHYLKAQICGREAKVCDKSHLIHTCIS